MAAVLHEAWQDGLRHVPIGSGVRHDGIDACHSEPRHGVGVLAAEIGGLALYHCRTKPPQVFHTRDRTTQRPLEAVEADADRVPERLVGFPRKRAGDLLATGFRGVGNHPGLRIGELHAECARRNRRLFQRVRADRDALRATVRAAHRRAVDVDIRFSRSTAPDRHTRCRSRLHHAGLEGEDLADVVDGEMRDQVARHGRAGRDLVARHDGVSRRLHRHRADRHRRGRQLDIHRQREAALHANARNLGGRIADESGAYRVGAQRHVVDEVVALVVRQGPEGRADDRHLRVRDRAALLVRHRAFDFSCRLLRGERRRA